MTKKTTTSYFINGRRIIRGTGLFMGGEFIGFYHKPFNKEIFFVEFDNADEQQVIEKVAVEVITKTSFGDIGLGDDMEYGEIEVREEYFYPETLTLSQLRKECSNNVDIDMSTDEKMEKELSIAYSQYDLRDATEREEAASKLDLPLSVMPKNGILFDFGGESFRVTHCYHIF